MSGSVRYILPFVVALSAVAGARGQVTWNDRPTLYVPVTPLSKQEQDRREALKTYVLGLLHVREDRMLDAVTAFEKAVQLDPTAAAVYKMLVPFYVALERIPDALTATRKVLDLDPDDYETWYMYARQLKVLSKNKEAAEALRRGLAVPALKERPEAAEPMYFLLGGVLENSEDFAGAAEAFGRAAKILEHPEPILELVPLSRDTVALRTAELYEKIGNMYLKAERYDQAVTAYKQAQDRYPDGAGRLNFNLAQLYRTQGKLAEALKYLDLYLVLQPQGLEAYEMKIKLLQNLKRGGEVLPWLEQASKADPFNVGLKLLVARSLADARQPEQAEKLYLELAAKSPTSDIYRGLFRLYLDQPRMGLVKGLTLLNRTLIEAKKENAGPNPAVAQAEAMVAALRDDGVVAQNLVNVAYKLSDRNNDLKFHTVHLLAVLADRHRQFGEAVGFYRQALNSATPGNEALLYSGLLRVLWKARKYEEIIQLCRSGLSRAQATNQTLFHMDLARALARVGKMDDALTQTERGLKFAGDPDRFAFLHLKVRLLVLAERYDPAEKECEALLKEFPQTGEKLETHYLLSTVYAAAHKMPQAEEQLALVLKIDPTNATANNDLGYIWADQGKNLKEAEELIRKAIELDRRNRQNSTSADADKENAAYIDSLGWVLFRRGNIDGARAELEKASKLDEGDDPTIWDHLGDVYCKLDQPDRARSAWQHALHLYERDKTRTMDQRYNDLKRKYKLLDSARQP